MLRQGVSTSWLGTGSAPVTVSPPRAVSFLIRGVRSDFSKHSHWEPRSTGTEHLQPGCLTCSYQAVLKLHKGTITCLHCRWIPLTTILKQSIRLIQEAADNLNRLWWCLPATPLGDQQEGPSFQVKLATWKSISTETRALSQTLTQRHRLPTRNWSVSSVTRVPVPCW